MKKKEMTSSLLLVLTAAIWGCAFVAQDVGAAYVEPLTFLASRSWIAFFMMLVLFAVMERRRLARGEMSALPPTRAARRHVLLGGFVCGFFLFAASYAQQAGMGDTTPAKAGFITAMYVVIVPVLAVLFRQRVRPLIWLCVAMGVAGLYLLSIKENFTIGIGDGLVMLCALLFSFQIMAVNYFAPSVDGVLLSMLEFLTESVLATAGMLFLEHPTAAGLAAAGIPIFYAGFFSSGIGYTLQIVAQQGLQPALASLIMSLESVFSALAGWIILGQTLTGRELGGCALLFAAILLSQLPGREAAGD